MKVHSTNYINTFIEVAEDCPVSTSEIPPVKGNDKTVANLQYEMLSKSPFKYTSDDLIFGVYAQKKDYIATEFEEQKAIFFSKGQACMRASPLTKRYGWGIINNAEGKIALVPLNSDEYQNLKNQPDLKTVKAMRSTKA
jgi:hypothetical protein